MRRGRRAMGPPPGTKAAPTSHCDKMAFSRLAKRISQASDSSLPTPVARPRIEAMDTTGARLRRASMSGSGCRTGLSRRHAWIVFWLCEEIPVRYEKAFNCAIKDHHLYLLISFDFGDNLIQWGKILRAENAHWR